MRFQVMPVFEGGGTRAVLALFIRTPSRREGSRTVENFFRDNALSLTRLHYRVVWISVVLQDLGELGPTSSFMEALCEFLREHPFNVALTRTHARPLRLTVGVSDEGDDAPHVDRSADPVVVEVTSRICRAFWENARFRTAEVVDLDLPAAPTREALELFYRGRNRNTSFHHSSSVTIRVSDRPVEAGNEHDVLQLEIGGLRLVGERSPHMASVADVVLGSAFPDAKAGLKISLYSPESVTGFTASLRGNRHHGFPHITFVAGDPREIGILDAPGAAAPPWHTNATLDMADLCGAVLQCPAVNGLAFEGLNFTAAAVDSARVATSHADAAAVLATLTFNRCTFSNPVHYGFCSLTSAIAPSRSLRSISLPDTPLQLSDMQALCSLLASSDWPLTTLALGDAQFGEGKRCLNHACVQHFFQMLPSMKTLKRLMFRCSVPSYLSRTVLDGIKCNYWLHQVIGLQFDTAPLQFEVESYTSANVNGRTAVYEAVANPGNRPTLETALGVLHRLSNSNEIWDGTTLYLCLQLVLPFMLRGPRDGAAGL